MNTECVKQFCHNCKKDVVAIKDEKGGIVFTCPVCGALNETKYISRREAKVKVRMPNRWYDDCG